MDQLFVTVRFWAGAKAAAGTDQVVVAAPAPITLTDLHSRVVALIEPGRREHLSRVIASCSVLVDGVGSLTLDPDVATVAAGQVVEMLPPFAGG